MVSRVIGKVRIASGAVAVQIVDQAGRATTSVEHIGSAIPTLNSPYYCKRLSNAFIQGNLPSTSETWNKNPQPWRKSPTGPKTPSYPLRTRAAEGLGTAKVITSLAAELWEILTATYAQRGFEVLVDVGSRAMDISESTSQMRKARFARTTGNKPVVDEGRIERALILEGSNGYGTNID